MTRISMDTKLGYMCTKLSGASESFIVGFFDNTGIKLQKDLHLTVVYDSRNPISMRELQDNFLVGRGGNPIRRNDKGEIITSSHGFCTVTGVGVLGSGEWQGLVLHLTAPFLEDYREKLHQEVFKTDFPKWSPHISLLYQPTSIDIETLERLSSQIIGTQLELEDMYWSVCID